MVHWSEKIISTLYTNHARFIYLSGIRFWRSDVSIVETDASEDYSSVILKLIFDDIIGYRLEIIEGDRVIVFYVLLVIEISDI